MAEEDQIVGRRKAIRFATAGAGIATAATVVNAAVNPSIVGAQTTTNITQGTGDRTAEIQAALDQAHNTGGGLVRLEAGNYRISAPGLKIGSHTTLQGEGTATILRAADNAFAHVVELRPDSEGSALRDLRVFGANIAGGVGVFTDLNAAQSSGDTPFGGEDSYVLVENVIVHDARTIGVEVGRAVNNFHTRAVRLNSVSVLRTRIGSGFLFRGVDSNIVNCFAANTPNGDGTHGFHITGGNNRIVGCKAFFNDIDGFRIEGSRSQITGCESQDNNFDGFRIVAEDVAMSACTADSNRITGIRLQKCEAITGDSLVGISRGGGRFPQRFGILVSSSTSNSRLTGIVRANSVDNLRVNSTQNIDTSGVIEA